MVGECMLLGSLEGNPMSDKYLEVDKETAQAICATGGEVYYRVRVRNALGIRCLTNMRLMNADPDWDNRRFYVVTTES